MILGLDIGGTKSAVVLGTSAGEILWRRQFATAPARGFQPVYDDLIKTAKEALHAASMYMPGAAAAGLPEEPKAKPKSVAYTPGMQLIAKNTATRKMTGFSDASIDGARTSDAAGDSRSAGSAKSAHVPDISGITRSTGIAKGGRGTGAAYGARLDAAAPANVPARDDGAFAYVNTVRLKALGEPVECIGVSIGGPMDSISGVIKSPPNLPHWDNVPLKDMLGAEFSLPVYVEHDGNAGALAEWYFGAGKGYRNLVFITMGTGFGAGLIMEGTLYRGSSNTAGEIGHIRIAEDGPACFGKAGSLEGYGSGTGMALLAQTMYPVRYTNNVTVQDIYADFINNSEEAAAVFHTAGKYVGRGLAMIADMINPECIILGGLGMRIGDAIFEPLLAAFNQEALKESAEACRIVPAQLGESIGDIAALSAAIYQSAAPHSI